MYHISHTRSPTSHSFQIPIVLFLFFLVLQPRGLKDKPVFSVPIIFHSFAYRTSRPQEGISFYKTQPGLVFLQLVSSSSFSYHTFAPKKKISFTQLSNAKMMFQIATTVLAISTLASATVMHVVTVGQNGLLQFCPEQITADAGDLVQFQFYPKVPHLLSLLTNTLRTIPSHKGSLLKAAHPFQKPLLVPHSQVFPSFSKDAR